MKTSKQEKCEFENCLIIGDTDLAILVRFPNREEPVWIPLSQVDIDSEIWLKWDRGKLVIPEWLAKDKGLI